MIVQNPLQAVKTLRENNKIDQVSQVKNLHIYKEIFKDGSAIQPIPTLAYVASIPQNSSF